ncbi:hypothetical protein [Brenneria corticis]|uniref:hypothetical protein n=1 Tax=Brenneria corticis TaxID=2173106 RepID=UPI00109DB7D7|nr:hypothetical protein [Brenneria sp. CFCC 11842]
MIEDDKKEVSSEPVPLRRLNIQSIKQDVLYRILAWSKSGDFDYKDIVVRSDDSVAKMEFFE